jgi:MFS family permease
MIMKTKEGIVVTILVGIVGALIGGFLLSVFVDIASGGWWFTLFIAILGAVIFAVAVPPGPARLGSRRRMADGRGEATSKVAVHAAGTLIDPTPSHAGPSRDRRFGCVLPRLFIRQAGRVNGQTVTTRHCRPTCSIHGHPCAELVGGR